MKKYILPCLLSFAISLTTTGCHHSSGAVWEDTKTLGRYLHRKSRMLWQKNVDSKMIEEENDIVGPAPDEYIAIDCRGTNTASQSYPYPTKHSPDKKALTITRDLFKNPEGMLVSVFQNLYFKTNQYAIKSKKEYKCLQEIANTMKNDPDLYLFIEGHCDERASEQYNLALGSKRANCVRKHLITLGVRASNIFTLSLGKEMPMDTNHNENAWAKNRRVVFKIYRDK